MNILRKVTLALFFKRIDVCEILLRFSSRGMEIAVDRYVVLHLTFMTVASNSGAKYNVHKENFSGRSYLRCHVHTINIKDSFC